MSFDPSDLLRRYEAGLHQIRQLLTIVPPDQLDTVPEPGAWTARQVIVHLSDSELIGAVRLRRVLAEERPRLLAYDEEAWSSRLDYGQTSAEEAVPLMVALRLWALARLKRATPAEWQRTCIHGGENNQVMTLAELVETYVDHVELHVQQLHQIKHRLANPPL